MFCDELDRLLDQHSDLTLQLFRQDGVTQKFYATDEEWITEYERLQVLEQRLRRVTADVVRHRRHHHCGAVPRTNA